MECSGEGEGAIGPPGVCQLDWTTVWSRQASLMEACRGRLRTESEGGPIPEPGPACLLGGGEASRATSTRVRPHTSYCAQKQGYQ
jgi:hypothetical protein